MPEQKFISWVFSRWYFYVIAIALFIFNNQPLNEVGNQIKLESGFLLGSIIGYGLVAFIITTIIYVIEPYLKRRCR